MLRSKILGVSSYLPKKLVLNNDLKQYMDTCDEWIQQRTGIKQRYWIDDPQISNSDLALEAVQSLLSKTGFNKNHIDCIIYATLSPDHDFPGTACFLQAKLEIPGIPAIDIRQQCSGFIYGLSIADQFIRSGMYKNILLVGSELHSKGMDKTTRGRDISVLFGDGAGAALITAIEVQNKKTDSYIYSTHLHADGSYAKELWIEAPGFGLNSETRCSVDMIEKNQHFPYMNGKQVFLHAVKRMSEGVMEGLRFNDLALSDVDLFLFHQANIRINEAVGKQLEIPEHKIFNTIEFYGNTTAATIPIGMADAEKCGKLQKGMLVAIAAFGSGFTWGSGILRW